MKERKVVRVEERRNRDREKRKNWKRKEIG